jgi:selenocysteine-specific elongation factor
MRVLCTAGHVDHGKSTLVKALTGMEPDRFAEERRRGLTIDLGFAWARLGGHTVAFVDLPGHERFIGNMLAGAGAVDLALFVVAADEGWMPQSEEHLDILDLLGVSRGLVAITKADTVDEERLAVVEELLRERLAGSAFAGVDAVPVSAVTGAGLDRLVERLGWVLDATPPPPDNRRPRLWVDRSFTVRGAGTVVTGTLGGGRLRVGDEVALVPSGPVVRIRGMQSLNTPTTEAAPGSRVALNLSGLARREVGRGDAVASPDQWLSVGAFEATVRAVRGHAIGGKGAWHLHVGCGERVARIYPLTAEVRGEGFVRIELDGPVALAAGDRFVLREAGRRATVGGGVVLDPDPPRRARGRVARTTRVAALEARRDVLRDPVALLALHVAERGVVHARRAAAAVGLHAEAARGAAKAAGLLTLGPAWAHPGAASRWATAVTDALRRYHDAHPLERAAPKDAAHRAAAASGCPPELAGVFLDLLARCGRVVAEGPGLRTPQHSVRLDPHQAGARDRLLSALSASPFSPPGLREAATGAGASTELVRELEAAGMIVRLTPDIALAAAAVEDAVAQLRRAYEQEGPLTAARAKQVLGTTRKFALPLLETLDRLGRTRRRGDVREVLD